MNRIILATLVALMDLPVVDAATSAGPNAEAVAVIHFECLRHAYLRGEAPVLLFRVLNNGLQELAGAQLTLDVGEVLQKTASLDRIAPGESSKCGLRVDTRLLRAGTYTIRCQVQQDGRSLATTEVPFHVARRWNPDRTRVWLWPHTKFAIHVKRLDDMARKQFAWYADIGVNAFQPSGEMNAEKFEVFDYALQNGWEMGAPLWGGLLTENPYDEDTKSPEERPLPPETIYTVRRDQKRYDAFHPAVAAEQDRRNRSIMEIVKQFPHVKLSFFNSEVGDAMLGIETPTARQRYVGQMETVPHEFLLPGVIPDQDENYVKALYMYKWGDGYTAACERTANLARAYVPDFKPFFDPHRSMACYDRYRGSAFISTWTYTKPDPKYMLYVETLIATGRYASQGVLSTVTLLNYPGSIFPKDKGWALMGPDRLVETSWINLSRRPEGLGIYFSSSCDPFDTVEEKGTNPFWIPNQVEPYQRFSPTYEAFRKFTREVVQPYGPMIGRLDRAPRRAAILSSESSRLYSNSPGWAAHYPNYAIYDFYILLNMIHIPTDVVFDETITRYGLDEYDALFLPRCETLTKSVYDRVLEFQKRGGLVVADQYLRAPISNVVRFDFDFTFRNKVTAAAILESKDYERWDDQIDVEKTKRVEVKGVTAEADQQLMERYAAVLREGLDGKIAREVECSSPTALLNLLEKDGARYLFIINDKRTYDDRTGPYKATLEKALPQTVAVRLHPWGDEDIHAYDMLARKKLPLRKDGEGFAFDVDLPAPGGKIIALLPQAISRLDVRAPERIRARGVAHKVQVRIADADGNAIAGVQPLRVRITDPDGNDSEFGDYYAAESGTLALDFIPARNDRDGTWTIEVEDLMAGLIARSTFQLER